MCEYAKSYYEHHGNLEVPRHFKTNNGYEYDENGQIKLGDWIAKQKSKNLPDSERGQQLTQIGMQFDRKRLPWEEMYEYAKSYYEHHGNLEVPVNFKTNNGYEYDENGQIKLGTWIHTQRKITPPESTHGKKLLQIGMRFVVKKLMRWEEMYGYAKIYSEHHNGKLDMKKGFKTNDGIHFESNGQIKLGNWIATQRQSISPNSEKGQLLTMIGMKWNFKNSDSNNKELELMIDESTIKKESQNGPDKKIDK
jgi:hypothetical protein